MIQRIFIVRQSGECVYYLDYSGRNCTDGNQDPQLISGFFMAIAAFAENTSGNNEMINSISLKNLNYHFHKQDGFFFILEEDQIISTFTFEDYREILIKIGETFHSWCKNEKLDSESPQMIQNASFDEEIRNQVSRVLRQRLFKKSK